MAPVVNAVSGGGPSFTIHISSARGFEQTMLGEPGRVQPNIFLWAMAVIVIGLGVWSVVMCRMFGALVVSTDV
jgi:hypothetical protein